jgi:hypothetical protein
MSFKVYEHLFGKDTKIVEAALILLAGIGFGVFIAFILNQTLFENIIVSILSADILSGLISNSRKETNQIWKMQSKMTHVMFLTFHLTIYPVILIIFIKNYLILGLLIFLLIIKVSFYTIGIFRN